MSNAKDSKVWLGPGGCVATNVDRPLMTAGSQILSGRMELTAIYIAGGVNVGSIGFWAATATVTPTNQIFGIYNEALARQCFTANDTTTAWNGNVLKALSLSGGTWVCPASAMYYVAVMVTATTTPTLYGRTLATIVLSSGAEPPLCGTSDSGLTTTVPATSAAIADSAEFRGAWLF